MACSGAPSEASNDTTSPRRKTPNPRIIGGTPSSAAQGSTVFIDLGGNGFCSGSLIAPNLVPTARPACRRCRATTSARTSSTPTTQHDVDRSRRDGQREPDRRRPRHQSVSGDEQQRLQLRYRVDTARPRHRRRQDRARALHEGDDERRRQGHRRRPRRHDEQSLPARRHHDPRGRPTSYTYKTKKGSSIPVSVSPGDLRSSESTCFGDSGGPLFDAAGFVIGVTRAGSTTSVSTALWCGATCSRMQR